MGVGKKGVTFEEKRERLLKKIQDEQSFYTLREIEKMGPSLGVIVQSVKEVLTSLVDDNLVTCDKIGNQNIFWCYKGDSLAAEKRRVTDLRSRVATMQAERLALNNSELQRSSAQQLEASNSMFEDMKTLETLNQELGEELAILRRTDVVVRNRLQRSVRAGNEAVPRWGDNICVVRQWIRKRLPNVSENEINDQFKIPADLE